MGARCDCAMKWYFWDFSDTVSFVANRDKREKLLQMTDRFSSSYSWLFRFRKQYVFSPQNKDELSFCSVNGKFSTCQLTLNFFKVPITFSSVLSVVVYTPFLILHPGQNTSSLYCNIPLYNKLPEKFPLESNIPVVTVAFKHPHL